MNPVLLFLIIILWLLAVPLFLYGLRYDDENFLGCGIVIGVLALMTTLFGAGDWEARHPVPPKLEQSAPNKGPTHIPQKTLNLNEFVPNNENYV